MTAAGDPIDSTWFHDSMDQFHFGLGPSMQCMDKLKVLQVSATAVML